MVKTPWRGGGGGHQEPIAQAQDSHTWPQAPLLQLMRPQTCLPCIHPPASTPCSHRLLPTPASTSCIQPPNPLSAPISCSHHLHPPPASCVMRVILHMARGEGSPESNLFWRRPGTVLFLRGAAPGPAVARPRPYTLLPPREATGPRRASAWWSWSAQAPTIQAGATRGRSGACTAVDALPAKWLASFTSREASRKRGLQAGRGTRVSRLRRLC